LPIKLLDDFICMTSPSTEGSGSLSIWANKLLTIKTKEKSKKKCFIIV